MQSNPTSRHTKLQRRQHHSTLTEPLAASFFVKYEDIHNQTQRRVTRCIQRGYIDGGPLTQARLEEFFRTDDFFIRATPGFFGKVSLIPASGKP